MSNKFLDGGIVKKCKDAFDKAKIMPGEMFMTEDQYRSMGKMLGWTDEQIEEGLKNSASLLLEEVGK